MSTITMPSFRNTISGSKLVMVIVVSDPDELIHFNACLGSSTLHVSFLRALSRVLSMTIIDQGWFCK
jgi:hypothetical protein